MTLRLPPPERVAQTLYDDRHPGAAAYAGAVPADLRRDIIAEVDAAGLLPAERCHGTVRQNFSQRYWSGDLEGLAAETPALAAALEEYAAWYSCLGRLAGFPDGRINSVGVHRYDAGCEGITPHKDFGSSINLVSVLVLEGCAPFYHCATREGEGRVDLAAGPGALILMRANRTVDTADRRPYHGVGTVERERWVACLREDLCERSQ